MTITWTLTRQKRKKSMKLLDYFEEAISIKRAYASLEVAAYCAKLAKRWGASAIDGAGNLHFDRRSRCSNTLFVAHTDTVHRVGGVNSWKIEDDFYLPCDSVLGADDAAGLAILQNLMKHKIPGYYIFATGEEVGGIGSKFLRENMGDLLSQFHRAIAFDRANDFEIITHQGGERCCSDEFAEALSTAFNDCGLLYAPSNGGVYTDTAEYVDYIPECTNIGVGYNAQHSVHERQSISHLEALADAAIATDWEGLPTKRDPEACDEGDDPFYRGVFLDEGSHLARLDSGRASATSADDRLDSIFMRHYRRSGSKRK